VLTVLFVISYSLMTLLIIEQGAAIQSQSNLIKVLMPESRELWGLKGKAIAEKQAAKAQMPSGNPAAANQAPSKDAQTSSAQGGAQAHAQNPAKAAKPKTQFPPIPVEDLNPLRTVRTI
jgi:hypothetical protein